MIFREATTDADAESIRVIRNSGREWMTRHTAEIDFEAQQDWWRARDAATCRIWLARVSSTDVGYGLLRYEDGQWWCSLAVLPRFQGNGYGTEIYRYLALATEAEVWAEILADNTPSLRAALRAGYHLAWALDKHAVLVHRKAKV
jgi:RimJ/RimL family protein N-acetyltransferase